jgi:intracellular sulfur oxidation DsrE/DsrF family protein
MGGNMKNLLALALIATIAFLTSSAVQAQDELPISGYPAARDVPGAHWLPDPEIEHKVVFDAATAPENIDDVNPMLVATARYVNTLAKYGVPAENRKVAVVFHQGASPSVLKNDAFKSRNDGQDNPNIDLIRSLHAAGVSFHLCGQAATGLKYDSSEIQEEIQLDLWALTTLIEYDRLGYARFGG